MKKTLLALCLLATLGATACDKKDKENVDLSNETQALLKNTEFTEKGFKSMIANKKAVTAIEYEALLRAIEGCEVCEEKLTLSRDCPAIQIIQAIEDDDDKDYSMAKGVNIDAIKAKLIKSDLAKVQTWLIPEVCGQFGVKKEKKTLLMDIAKTASEAILIKQIIQTISNEIKDKAVADYILSYANDKNTAIRSAVADAVTNSWAKEVDGMLDVAIKFLDDEDKDIRINTCSKIGDFANDKVIQPIVDILKDGEEQYRHSYCMSALYKLWYDEPFHENTSEAAYKATLDYLKTTPRNQDIPKHTGKLRHVGKDAINAWKAKADYFKLDEYLSVMSEIASDPNGGWDAREGAIQVIQVWGTKTDLKTLKEKLAQDTSDLASAMAEKVDQAIENQTN